MEIKRVDFNNMEEINHWSGPARIVRHIAKTNHDMNVIEIGTGYGEQLLYFVPLCSHVVCIDPMYDWVPDIVEDQGFDENRVCEKKLASWNTACKDFIDKITLIVGNSFLNEVINDERHTKYDLIIIDGCHHPVDAVCKDYWNYQKYMNYPHYVLFDDINQADPGAAFGKVQDELRKKFNIVQVENHGGKCSTVGLMLVDKKV